MKHLLKKPVKSKYESKDKVQAYYGEFCAWSDCWVCDDTCGGCTGTCELGCGLQAIPH